MKNIYVLVVIFFCFSALGTSQTEAEKQDIICTYNPLAVKKLQKSIIENSEKRNERINVFLSQNPQLKRVQTINNKKYQIYDIIDNNPIYITTNNVNSAISTRTNFLHNGGGLGLNLEGQNMTIGVWDQEQALDSHVEFLDNEISPSTRVTKPDFLFGDPVNFHATHVAGTLIAKGVNAAAKGMAPQANLVSYNWDDDAFEVSNEASNNALLLSNHSYGVPVTSSGLPSWYMGCYNQDASQWDNIAYTFPYYLHVVSAGNDGSSSYVGGLLDGYDKLTGARNSKNNLVVASANNPVIDANGNLISLSISDFSSQGPSDDGRIKPDIAGDGAGVFSTLDNSNSSYGTLDGTSMSSPNVSGSLLLLQQYYNSLNSQYMKAATLKGLVCHTADDDAINVGPDPFFGWGLLNSKAAAETILNDTNGSSLISELTLANSETYSTTVTSPGTGQLSVTICWTDPAGASQSGVLNSTVPALVNDLDLRLKHPNGFLVYQPWKLLTFNIPAGAIKGDNIVDTVENIDLDVPSAGTYTIEVSHKGTLLNPQDFSLIVTGTDITLSNNNVEGTNNLSVWPNPTKDILYFNYNAINSYSSNVSLVDMQGRVVYSNSFKSAGQFVTGQIDTNSYSSGVYTFVIEQGNSRTHKKVIIK
jgi:serine protease AprX